jgi:hypothetical protein
MKKKLCFFMLSILGFTSPSLCQWQLSGNTGTNQNTNFIGTTDNQQLRFRTNNLIRMRLGTSAGVENPGALSIGDIDPDLAPFGGTLILKGNNNATAISMIKSPNSGNGWDNQIRFYSTNNLRHVIADDYTTGKLVIQTNVDPNSGSVDVLDIRGRVQIGQGGGNPDFTTPAGYGLYVANGILTERVKVSLKTTGDWADYVFADNYKLRTFSELETFIRNNRHLPGVPSADEMVKQGNDLAKTDAKLLEKIEELTLYVIQLNKEKDALNKKVVELSADKKNNDALFKTLEEQLTDIKKELEKMRK